MNSPYYQLDEDIKNLIRQGCSTNEVFQTISSQHPAAAAKAQQLLMHIQQVERDLRDSRR